MNNILGVQEKFNIDFAIEGSFPKFCPLKEHRSNTILIDRTNITYLIALCSI